MRKFFLFSFLVFFTGCATNNLSNNSCENYFNNYNRDGKIVGIGIANININGEDSQRKSAIAKALDEIAKQKGIIISSVTTTSVAKNNSFVSRSYNNYSIQTVNGEVVKAKIIKACKGIDGKFYVLMEAY